MGYRLGFRQMVRDLLTIMARLKSGAVVAFVCIQGQSRSVLMARVVMEALGVDAESACQDIMLLTLRSFGRCDSENLIHLSLVYLFVVCVLHTLASSMAASLSCPSVC